MLAWLLCFAAATSVVVAMHTEEPVAPYNPCTNTAGTEEYHCTEGHFCTSVGINSHTSRICCAAGTLAYNAPCESLHDHKCCSSSCVNNRCAEPQQPCQDAGKPCRVFAEDAADTCCVGSYCGHVSGRKPHGEDAIGTCCARGLKQRGRTCVSSSQCCSGLCKNGQCDVIEKNGFHMKVTEFNWRDNNTVIADDFLVHRFVEVMGKKTTKNQPDDAYGFAFSRTHVFWTPDSNNTFSLLKSNLDQVTELDRQWTFLVTDWHSQQLYAISTNNSLNLGYIDDDDTVSLDTLYWISDDGVDVLRAKPLGGAGPIHVPRSTQATLFFGAGEALFYFGDSAPTSLLWRIDLETAETELLIDADLRIGRDYDAFDDEDLSAIQCEGKYNLGTIEYHEGRRWLLIMTFSGLVRVRVPQVLGETLFFEFVGEPLIYANEDELCKVAISPHESRWYYHTENGNLKLLFGGFNESMTQEIVGSGPVGVDFFAP